MEDHNEGQPLRRRRKKKLRIGRVFFTFFTLIFIAAGVYSVVQYNAGKSLQKGMSLTRVLLKGMGSIRIMHQSKTIYSLVSITMIAGSLGRIR